MWRRAFLVVDAVAALVVVALVTPAAFPITAEAAFPGENGQITFISDRDDDDGDPQIFVMDADGSNPTNLTSDLIVTRAPAFSPDGAKIAFSAGDIYVMDADGSNRTNITNNAAFEHGPAFSPDGSKIAFMRCVDCGFTGRQNYEIFVMDADGSNATRLTNSPGTGPDDATGGTEFDAFPAFSPDGTKIAFTSQRDGNGEIYVMDADGSDPTNITNNAAYETAPAFSPDGSKIAFSSNGDIYVMDADGSNRTNLTNDQSADDSPAFSPDGTKIAFSKCVTFCFRGLDPDSDVGPEIFVMDADGSDPINLTNNAAWDTEPDWGPALQSNAPPDCSAVAASPSLLTASGKQLRPVTLGGATDLDGDTLSYQIDSVTQDEPVTDKGDDTSPDAATGANSNQVQLRAEANPQRNGRVYRVAYTVSDGNGGTCTGVETVSVSRKKGQPAIDDGNTAAWNSFSGAKVTP